MIYKPLALRRGGSSYLCSYVKVFYPFIINILIFCEPPPSSVAKKQR
nr:MAG TPA: hypothetical protein [Caudoviricetes sp.]